MATKKQMNETINRVDIVEDNMLKMEDHIGLLREMISMQNKHIESMMHLIINNEKKKFEKKELPIIIDDNLSLIKKEPIKNETNKANGYLKYSRRII